MSTEFILVNLAALLAGVVQATAGLGFVMVAAPLIGLVSLAYLPGSVLLANILLSVAMFWRDGKSLDRSEVSPLVLGLVFGTVLGAIFLNAIPTDRLGVVFGSLILIAVALSVFSPQAPLTRRNVMIGATAGGFTGIVAGMHGPPLVMLYQREAPSKIRATFATVFIIGVTLALFGLWLSGRFGGTEFWLGISMLPGVVLGFAVGRLITPYVTQSAARAGMLTISGLGGAMLLIKSL